MKRRGLGSLVCLSLAFACNVAEVPLAPSAIAENQCESNEDCPGSTCDKPSGQGVGACVASTTTVPEILIQVTPPAAYPTLGGLSFYKSLDVRKATNGQLNIELEPVAHVDGRVVVETGICPPASLKGQTVPVEVSFTPSQQILGIATSLYSAAANPASTEDEYRFVAEIPAGQYDVYLKPKVTGCELPPQLILAQQVAGDLSVGLGAPHKLQVEVYWPSGEELTGWSAALLDEPTGRVISTQAVLLAGEPATDRGYRYAAELAYYKVKPPEESGKAGAEPSEPSEQDRARILRLTPPAGVERPSLLAENLGELVQKGVLPPNVVVKGQTAILGKSVPVAASLKLTARTLTGFDAGILAAYSRTVSVPAEGLFELSLPPGSYHVEATPVGASGACSESGSTEASPCLAVAQTTWDVGVEPEVQAGRLLEFPEATLVRGTAKLWTNAVPLGATVHVTASPSSVQAGLVDTYLGSTEPLPRASSGLVRAGGAFSFSADPGLFDLIVQTDPSTRFGWYAWSIRVPEVEEIGIITLQAPAAYQGVVRLGGSGDSAAAISIPNSLIRAYADADGKPGGHVVPIAETWANDQGRFELLIPRMLGPAPVNRANESDEAEAP